MKIYYEAGLHELAVASGYPPNSIKNCTIFSRTHDFLLEAWESFYQHFLTVFLQNMYNPDTSTTEHSDTLAHVSQWLQSFPTATSEQQCHRNLQELLSDVMEKHPMFLEDFDKFMQSMASRDQSWRFWQQFVFQDCLAYLGLFLAIRTGNWHLRMASMKQMAALFTAFDRPCYEKLIAQHIHDICKCPTPVLNALQRGGFSISFRGMHAHNVAIDEAHEMAINKDCKEAITKPSADYIKRVATFLPVRSKSLKKLRCRAFS